MNKKKYINLKEASELLGVAPDTMKKIILASDLKYTRIKRKFLINQDELIEYLSNHKNITY